MQKISTFFLVLFFTSSLFLGISQGDEITLKSGETLSGKITYEADDIVKIEIAVSSSIKETKIIARGDIAEIKKEAPDSVAFQEIESKMPIGSLVSASQYRSLIETGPESFLRRFPESPHVEKVKEIQVILEEELDKVERGFLKIEEEWISPQDKATFETLIKSRIQFLKMEAASRIGNHNGIIAAMREFEVLEETFYGTPSFPKALEFALQAIPALGNRLNGMARDVDYRNAEWERSKATLNDESRAQVEAARKREEDTYLAGLEADKKAGIKWVRLNPRSKSSIESYLSLASSELKRLRGYDIEQLKAQAEKLVEVDELIAKNNYELARTRLNSALEMSGQTGSQSNRSSTSYISALSEKLKEKVAEQEALEKARTEAAKSEALAANLNKKADSAPSSDDPETEEPQEGSEEMAEEEAAEENETETTEEAPEDPANMFAALSGAEKGKAKEEGDSKNNPDPKKEAPEAERERPAPVVVDEGGGFPISLIIPIVTVLLLVTVVALKVLGVGGKKKESGEES